MIKDPRQYTTDYPNSNILINLAIEVLNNKADFSDLKKSLSNFLKNENDALINVALNLSPSFEVSNIIWQALNKTINDMPEEVCAQIFAIPLVLVAGSKTKAQIKGVLDVNKLNLHFQENQIFDDQIDSFISGKLLDLNTLAKFKPSQLYYWSRNLRNANLWLPVSIEGTSIEVLNEGVFLRFLIGLTINRDDLKVNFESYRNSSMKLMKLINDELHNDAITLFPIPFEPVYLSEAYLIGDNKRKEIAISVAMSNIVRKIREQGLVPNAIIDTDEDIIKISVTNNSKPELSEISLWHLTKFEDYKEHLVTITNLLQDMQVEYSYARKD